MPTHNTVPFAAGETWAYWTWPSRAKSADAPPTEVRVETDAITEWPNPDLPHGTVRLTAWDTSLDDDLDNTLAELLLTIPGVRPDDWLVDEHGTVEVPLAEPTTITDARITWQVTADLAVHHVDRTEGSLTLPADPQLKQAPFTDLTYADCARLITALAALQSWRDELMTAFAIEATARRRALQRTRKIRDLARPRT